MNQIQDTHLSNIRFNFIKTKKGFKSMIKFSIFFFLEVITIYY